MCKTHNPRKIDKCMKSELRRMERWQPIIKTVACCCGHGRYPETIVVKVGNNIYELNSLKQIPRKRKFYKKDKKGYYYIPEVCSEK